MIQRIQSFYLVLAVVGIILLFMFPIATYTTTNAVTNQATHSELNLIPKGYQYANDADGTAVPTFIGQEGHRPNTLPLIILAAIIGVVSLVSIFLYKNRVRQMRIVAVAFMLNVIYIFLVFFLYVDKFTTNIIPEMGVVTLNPHYSVGTYAPLASVLFLFLAQRAIKKDELKVRAADRLR